MKNTRKNLLKFVNKYNNQRKVNEIMTYIYEEQIMQTYYFPPKFEAPILSCKHNYRKLREMLISLRTYKIIYLDIIKICKTTSDDNGFAVMIN